MIAKMPMVIPSRDKKVLNLFTVKEMIAKNKLSFMSLIIRITGQEVSSKIR